MGKKGNAKGNPAARPLQLVKSGVAPSSVLTPFAELFSLDVRALALFRMGLGSILVGDLLIRATDLVAHYTDVGVLPRAVQLEKYAGYWELSLHWISGHAGFIGALFVLQALCAVLLFVGYRARLMTVLSWILLVSLQNRNPMVLHSGDVLFRMILFWAMFLPLGEKWSVDAAMDPEREIRAVRVLSAATVAILGQIFIEYFFAALNKVGPDWHSDGNAIFYALNVEQFATPVGIWFRNHFAGNLKFLTHVIWFFELLGPFLFFCPLFFWQFRFAAFVAFVMMHLNFEVMLGIGIFPFICITGLLPFVPTQVFDWLSRRATQGTKGNLSIFYDGDCAFCRKMVLLLREAFFLRTVRIAPAEEEPAIAKLLSEQRSWVVVPDGEKPLLGFAAFTAVVAHSPVFRVLATVLRWKPVAALGAFAYRFVANRRASFGSVTAEFLPLKNRRYRLSATGSLIVTALFAYVFFWNVASVAPKEFQVPQEIRFIAFTFRLDQRWNMFSQPIREDGWLVLPGHLANGRDYDVYNGVEQAVSWARPKLLSATYPNERWQKYLMNVQMKSNSDHRLHYGRYLCRVLNADRKGDLRLKDFEMFLMMEKLTPKGREPAEKVSLWQHKCY